MRPDVHRDSGIFCYFRATKLIIIKSDNARLIHFNHVYKIVRINRNILPFFNFLIFSNLAERLLVIDVESPQKIL